MAMRLSAKMLQLGALKVSPSYTGAAKGCAGQKTQVLPSKLLAVDYRLVLGGNPGIFQPDKATGMKFRAI